MSSRLLTAAFVAATCFSAVVMPADANAAGYARPLGAGPLRVPLVVTYSPCFAPNRTHGAPLAFPSCSPPSQSSAFLTVGSPDANGNGARAVGSARLDPVIGDPTTPVNEADIRFQLSVTDVRLKTDLSDYAGQLQFVFPLGITAETLGIGSTSVQVPFAIPVNCTVTADPAEGSTCAMNTTANTVIPGSITEGQRAVLSVGQIKVFDGGVSGMAGAADNTLFMVQGVFIP
jgi:hypothetical protein